MFLTESVIRALVEGLVAVALEIGDDAWAGRSSCSSGSEARPLSPAPLCYSYTLQLDANMESMLQPCHPIPPPPAHCFVFQLWAFFFLFLTLNVLLFSHENPDYFFPS